MIRRPPRSTRIDTLVPYTTLFRSAVEAQHIETILAPARERPFLGKERPFETLVAVIGLADLARRDPAHQRVFAVGIRRDHFHDRIEAVELAGVSERPRRGAPARS